MLLPIRTDRRLQRTPWVNYGLIAVNIAIFMATRDKINEPAMAAWFLFPPAPRLYQFITYQFLHASPMHVAGNMLFLFVFGNSVEDRLGRIAYLGFYLAGGVLAGLGHALIEPEPVLGASGAIAAVSGAYLALFPRSRVTIIYFFFIIGAFEISSMYVIGFYFLFDLGQYLFHMGQVAYMAHLTGYAFGFLLGLAMLLGRLLPREPYDFLAMLEHRRRRVAFVKMTKAGYQPWEAPPETAAPAPPPPARPAPAAPLSAAEQARRQRIAQLRSTIAGEIADQRMSDAATHYADLLDIDHAQVLPRQPQLDVSNQLMSDGRHALAARGYELFLGTYPADPQREQVQLLLGVLYVRYLDRRQRGRELLSEALRRLTDPAQINLARTTLASLDA